MMNSSIMKPSRKSSRTDVRTLIIVTDVSLSDLEAQFVHERCTNKRAAAETAYALACRYRNEDVDGKRRFDIAKTWALRAIELLDVLPSDKVEQVVSTRLETGGVPIPNLLHSAVVRIRLEDLLV